ncbi:S1C family serine protease [Nocardioides euryhalodurans]|uniref:PDZ domain-containing protein n=1 Tax=Nocardioides euryhalodurans TaxID=2518370 RepID=A0A4V1BE68_9ACTN|nr:trypsin-like peptidase domain-containing protein [Nocardioides euryhalodurans]QBR93572.1 PDZ domain-containing protein [Nocardioides euryhalodurans]
MSDTRVLPPFPPERDPYGHEAVTDAPAPTTTAPPRTRRRGLAATVLATALVAGGAAGVGGAAAWDAWQEDGPTTFDSAGTETAQVVDTGDEPAADGSVEAVASKVLPSVVRIVVQGSEGEGSGSGIILSSDGQILTNAHVVDGAGEGAEMTVSFDDGTHAPATVVGSDPLTDTAVIQAEGVEGLTPATIGTSGNVDVGQEVVAIGSPFGLDSTVTSGIVSALDRPVNVGSDAAGNATVYPAIQTDAAINPGNSGGALVDMDGNVVGINSSIRTSGSSTGGSGGSIGLGFAIPIDEVLPIIDQIVAGETPTHALIGVSVSDAASDDGGATVPNGAAVGEVTEGSAAAEAGLEPGDVITAVDGRLVTSSDALIATVRSYRPGDEVELTFQRDGEEQTTTVTLGSDAESGTS